MATYVRTDETLDHALMRFKRATGGVIREYRRHQAFMTRRQQRRLVQYLRSKYK